MKKIMKNRKIRLIISFVLLILWGGLMFILSSQNGTQTLGLSWSISSIIGKIIHNKTDYWTVFYINSVMRYVAHFVLFFVFGALLLNVADCIPFPKKYVGGILSSVVIVTISFVDELHKIFIPGRHFHLPDATINSISGLMGIWALFLLFFIFRKKVKKNKVSKK